MAKLAVMKGIPYEEKRLRQWLREDGGVVCQVKRDEIRCLVEVNVTHHHTHDDEYTVSYTSASGKPLYNLQEHSAMWLAIARISGLRKFDTGVSIEGRFDLTRRVVLASKKVYNTLGDQMYAIKEVKKKVTTFEYTGALQARFWLYDLPDLLQTYEYRRLIMADIAGGLHSQYIATPETEVFWLRGFREGGFDGAATDTIKRVQWFYADCLANDHEGSMVKRFCHAYREGRTTDWMKKKPCEEVDGEVIGFTPGKNAFAGLVGSINCRAEDGSLFSISGFPMDLRQDITADPDSYIGKWVEARYMEREDTGGYRHPRFYRWHPDK